MLPLKCSGGIIVLYPLSLCVFTDLIIFFETRGVWGDCIFILMVLIAMIFATMNEEWAHNWCTLLLSFHTATKCENKKLRDKDRRVGTYPISKFQQIVK